MPILYGSPVAIKLMDEFFAFITNKFNLSQKVIMFGFSRGGLYALNFAASFPKRASILYLDAPVVDVYSWSLGRGYGVRLLIGLHVRNFII